MEKRTLHKNATIEEYGITAQPITRSAPTVQKKSKGIMIGILAIFATAIVFFCLFIYAREGGFGSYRGISWKITSDNE